MGLDELRSICFTNENFTIMKTKLFLIAIVATTLSMATIGTVSAQRTITPFTKRVLDSAGKKVYVQPQEKRQSRIAVTFGYGYSAVTSHNSYANGIFPFVHNNLGRETEGGDITSSLGTISIGFNYEINPWLELNIPFVYSSNKGKQPYIMPNGVDESGELKDDWVSLLPSLKINWMRNNWLSLYTRVGVGVSFANRWVTVDQDMTSKVALAYQISPIGVEMGKGRFNFFIEGGYGHVGMVTAGIKFKVGKMLKTGKVSTGRHVDWYDKYLH